MDQEAKHHRKMKNAIWLFLYLLLHADRRSGFVARKVRTIATDTGIGKSTIRRWLKTLRTGGYVATRSTGRCLLVQIEKWKPLPEVLEMADQSCQICNPRVCRDETPRAGPGERVPVHSGDFSPVFPAPNESTLKKLLLRNDNGDININDPNDDDLTAFKPTSREELLALDLAVALDDPRGLPLYLSYARRFPESFLRQVLGEVKEMPSERIKKSRAALFNHLVHKYAQTTNQNPGD